MMQDDRISNAIEPVGVSEVISAEKVVDEQIYKIDKLNLQFPVREKEVVEYVDFIQRPVSLLSDKLKQLIEKYVPDIYTKSVVLVDINRVRQDLYWLVVPPRIKCLSHQSEFHKDGTVKKLVIDEKKVASYKVFKIDGIMEEYTVISLDVAESLLRRDFMGIRLKKIEKQSMQKEVI